jgi:hypothetical protein
MWEEKLTQLHQVSKKYSITLPNNGTNSQKSTRPSLLNYLSRKFKINFHLCSITTLIVVSKVTEIIQTENISGTNKLYCSRLGSLTGYAVDKIARRHNSITIAADFLMKGGVSCRKKLSLIECINVTKLHNPRTLLEVLWCRFYSHMASADYTKLSG